MTNLKSFLGAVLCAGALGVFAAGAVSAAGHSVRMGTEGAYPPYNFINDAGQVDGANPAAADGTGG